MAVPIVVDAIVEVAIVVVPENETVPVAEILLATKFVEVALVIVALVNIADKKVTVFAHKLFKTFKFVIEEEA